MCVQPHLPTGRLKAMTELITRTDLEALVATGAVILVDALPASYYDQLHLPGANGLDLPAFQHHAGLEALCDEVVITRTAVFGNGRADGRGPGLSFGW